MRLCRLVPARNVDLVSNGTETNVCHTVIVRAVVKTAMRVQVAGAHVLRNAVKLRIVASQTAGAA